MALALYHTRHIAQMESFKNGPMASSCQIKLAKAMIIQLDLSLISELNALNKVEWAALDLLARCHGEGKHLLVIGRPLAIRLAMNHDQLSAYSRSVYHGISQKASTYPPERLSRIGNTILVCKDSINLARSVKQSNTNQIPVSLAWFSQSDRVQPSHLICEHISDCNVYIAMATKYLNHISLHGLCLSFRTVSGGGHAIGDVIRHTLADHSPALCIVDSDKDSSSSVAIGKTARDARKSFDQSSHDKACFVMLDARELENLLPDLILESIWPSENKQRTSIIRHLSRVDSGKARLFIDIKEDGLRLVHIFATRESDDIALSFPPIRNIFPSLKDDCLASAACGQADICECSLLAPLGSKALDSAIEPIQRQNFASLLDGLSDAHKLELQRVLQFVVDWGIAGPRVTA